MQRICDIDQLESVVGSRPLAAMMKSIDHLDDHCARLLAASPLAVVGHTDTDGRIRATVVGGVPGFAGVASSSALDLGDALAAVPGSPVSTLFFVPGWRETLRINGSLRPGSDDTVEVREAFVHCAKAVIRSKLWESAPQRVDPPGEDGATSDVLGAEMSDFLARSPFVVVASHDASGHADASPKGDPPGFVGVLDASTIAIPDRRGNRRTDTFHNVIEHPEVALLALCPGDDRVLELHGTAQVTDDRALLESMSVGGKPPHAAMVLTVDGCRLTTNRAITDSGMWDPATHVDPSTLPRASRIWTDHVKANSETGAAAAAIRVAANERALRAGLAVDYRHGLY